MIQPERDVEYSSKSRLRRVMTTVLIAFLLLIGYFLTQSYFKSLAEAENASLMRLNGIVYTLAMQMDGDAHQRLMAKYTAKDAITTSKQDQDYLAIHQVLRRNTQANMLNTAIYTIVLDSSNTCYFGVTSDEKPYFRHPYHSAPALLMEKHAEGAMIPRYQDEFGTWLSAFAAIRNSKGEMVALVQADQKFDDFMAHARAEVLQNLLVGVLMGTFFLVLLIRILQPILRKERLNKEALSAANMENKRIAAQLQQSLEHVTALDNFRREMIANLSHDLRTPMASILGYLETIIQKKALLSDVEQEKFLHVALSESNRLNKLVNELFDLSKLESGQIHIEPEPFNIAELAQDTLQKYQLQADTKHVKLLTDFSHDLPLAFADLRWIDRVLQNLLDNALRYVYEGGFVMFTVFEKDNILNFKVCNSGDPIPEAHLDRVFDRYFKSSNRKKDSTGLGLTVVKKIVELHGERVWAESNDTVTTFRFTLPVYRSS
ncbi:MAG: HAMP domain-containing histidine kinase [Saprospiraceae bacterium]|nr:HAMP domain-containing histidine kinase [Saprospiraceae bacterium]